MELNLGQLGQPGFFRIRAHIHASEFARAEAHAIRRVAMSVFRNGRETSLEDVTFDGFSGRLSFGPRTPIINEVLPFILCVEMGLATEFHVDFQRVLDRLATTGTSSLCPTEVRPAPAMPRRGDEMTLAALGGCRVRVTQHCRDDFGANPLVTGHDVVVEGILSGVHVYDPETGERIAVLSARDERVEITRSEDGLVREVYYNGGTSYHYATFDGRPHGSWTLAILS